MNMYIKPFVLFLLYSSSEQTIFPNVLDFILSYLHLRFIVEYFFTLDRLICEF